MTRTTEAPPTAGVVMIALAEIRADPEVQPREAIDEPTVAEYAEHAGDLPHIDVFAETEVGPFWLGDGWHRLAAWRRAGWQDVPCRVHEGGRRAAILHAVGSNARHGLRRTNGDKRRAVALLLRDPQWARWSDAEIGRRCQVDHKTVAAVREAILGNSQDAPRLVDRGGTTYPMRTDNIGPKATPPALEPCSPTPAPAQPSASERIAQAEVRELGEDDPEPADPVTEMVQGCTLATSLTGTKRRVFERDARIYLRLAPLKEQIDRIIREETRGRDTMDPRGAYEQALEHFLHTPHPRDWKLISADCPDQLHRRRGYIVP